MSFHIALCELASIKFLKLMRNCKNFMSTVTLPRETAKRKRAEVVRDDDRRDGESDTALESASARSTQINLDLVP